MASKFTTSITRLIAKTSRIIINEKHGRRMSRSWSGAPVKKDNKHGDSVVNIEKIITSTLLPIVAHTHQITLQWGEKSLRLHNGSMFPSSSKLSYCLWNWSARVGRVRECQKKLAPHVIGQEPCPAATNHKIHARSPLRNYIKIGTISPCTKIRRSVQLGVAYKKCAAGTNILTARVRYLLRRLTCRRIDLEHAMAASDRRNPLVCNNTLAEFASRG